jgi:hypothetical protein
MKMSDEIEVPKILQNPVPLKDEDTPEGTFDLSFRVMNNEVLGFAMRVDDFKAKWLILGLIAIGVLGFVATAFGPMIMNTFGG